jgi:DNA-binding transcriptional MerR regulator
MPRQRTLTISEAADALGISPSWLRFGERLGALPRARRGTNGWRYYTLEDIERLHRLGVGRRKQQLLAGHDE